MGLDVVLNEIVARGAEEEQRILRDAERERAQVLAAAEGEADELRAKALQDTRGKVEALRREQHSATEFEVRRRLLTAQRELTEDFRSRVLAALGKLPRAERDRLLRRLLARVQTELPEGTLHANRDDLAALGASSTYARGNELPTVGGLQVESPDGTLLLDYRFESLLEQSWKAILADTRTLFELE